MLTDKDKHGLKNMVKKFPSRSEDTKQFSNTLSKLRNTMTGKEIINMGVDKFKKKKRGQMRSKALKDAIQGVGKRGIKRSPEEHGEMESDYDRGN